MSYINEYFTYDNKKCTDYGIILVHVGGGLNESQFGVSRSIQEEKVNGRSVPYFYGVEEEPKVIPLTIAKEGKWTYDDKTKIAEWLFPNEYKQLVLADNPNICYYCMPVNDPTRFFNGIDEGYVELQMRCDAPFGWSNPIEMATYDLSDNTTTTVINLYNKSNVASYKYYYPEVEIEMVGSAGVTLKNLSDKGREFAFTGLNTDETIYVNNQRKQIISDTGLFRLGNFNKNWLRLLQGENRIEVTGQCKIQTKMQFPMAL